MSTDKRSASQSTPNRQRAEPDELHAEREQKPSAAQVATLPASPLVRIWHLLRTTISEWQSDNAARLAAALAYYTVFSMAPLLIITIAILGFFIGPQAAQGQVVGQLRGLVGQSTAEFVQSVMAGTNNGQANLLLSIIGIVTLLLGATGVFGELQSSLNQIWDVPPKTLSTSQAITSLLSSRLVSLGMVLVIGFLLLVSLVLSTVLAAFSQWAFGDAAEFVVVGQVINFLLSFLVTTFLFGLIYKVLPDVRVRWRDVWIGGAVTALLFSVGRFLISLYLSHSSVSSVYGAAGSLAVLLLWVYYSAQILFLGAEFTQVYARQYGSNPPPENPAEKQHA